MKIILVLLLLSFSLQAESTKPLNVFESLINPILEAKCVHCHGPNKDKGKLRMDSKEHLLQGGRGAGTDIIVKGDIDSSEMIYRIMLPKEDEEAMPPFEEEHYNPVTKEELSVIKSWIKLGASFKLSISELDEKSQIAARHVLKNMPKKSVTSLDLLMTQLPEVPKVEEAVLEKIASKGILIMPIAQNTNALYANASYLGKSFDDQMLGILSPVANQLLWLNLARTGITDKSGPIIQEFQLLTRLHLENTSITDEIMPFISELKNLEYLNLYSTSLTDESVTFLKSLNQERFLWQTNISADGAENLKKSFADSSMYEELKNAHRKRTASVEQLKQKSQLSISKLESKLQEVSSTTSDKVQVNSNCPVSGKPIVENQFSIFEGRKVAFCCKNCKSKFDKDSGSYRSKIANFKPSDEFMRIAKAQIEKQKVIDQEIGKENDALREVYIKLKSIGPEINLGWSN